MTIFWMCCNILPMFRNNSCDTSILGVIYHSSLFYILRLMCKEKNYSQNKSCLNRLIVYFHNINFYNF